MYELRGIFPRLGVSRSGAFGLGLCWMVGLAACAGGAGEGTDRSEQGRRTGAEARRSSPGRGTQDVFSGPGRGEVISPGDSDPGTLGSNTNWRPGEPGPDRDPLPWPLAPDAPQPALAPEEPGDPRDEAEGDAPEQDGASADGIPSGSSTPGSAASPSAAPPSAAPPPAGAAPEGAQP